MAQMVVRKIEDTVKARLLSRARRNGRSLEAEAREILTRAANTDEPDGETEGLGTRISRRFADCGLAEGEVLERPGGFSTPRLDFSGPEWDSFDK